MSSQHSIRDTWRYNTAEQLVIESILAEQLYLEQHEGFDCYEANLTDRAAFSNTRSDKHSRRRRRHQTIVKPNTAAGDAVYFRTKQHVQALFARGFRVFDFAVHQV